MDIGPSGDQHLHGLFVTMHACSLDGGLAIVSAWGVVDGGWVSGKNFGDFVQFSASRRKL
jgi:hypothetical protein